MLGHHQADTIQVCSGPEGCCREDCGGKTCLLSSTCTHHSVSVLSLCALASYGPSVLLVAGVLEQLLCYLELERGKSLEGARGPDRQVVMRACDCQPCCECHTVGRREILCGGVSQCLPLGQWLSYSLGEGPAFVACTLDPGGSTHGC